MKEIFELTDTQKQVLFMGTLDGAEFCNDKIYIWGQLNINQKVNFKRLNDSINYFIKKNDAVRTRLCLNNGVLMQYFQKYQPVNFEIIDVKNNDDVEKLKQEIIDTPLKMMTGFLYILKMYRYPDGRGGAIIKMHHMISDGWSIGLAAHEIINYYTKRIPRYITYSFADYIKTQQKYELSKSYQIDKEYWNKIFNEGLPKLVSLPFSMPPKENYSIKGSKAVFDIDNDLIVAVKKYCKENRISVPTFFTSIYSVYLRKMTNESKFMLATMSSNRKTIKEKISIGLYTMKAYFLIEVPNIKFKALARNIGKSMAAGFKHREYISRYQQDEFKKRGINQIFMANYLVSYQDMDLNTKNDRIDYEVNGNNNVGPYGKDMVIHILDIKSSDKFQIAYDYLAEKFTPQDIENVNDGIIDIINQVIKSNDITVSKIDVKRIESNV